MTAIPMAAEMFWSVIERSTASTADPDAQEAALRAELSKLRLEEIIAFEVAFRRYLNAAYTWDLWGAAYVVHGGCSDDGFEYFRRWLVTRGRSVYEAALADPDSMAERDLAPGPDGVWEFEEIYYAIGDVFDEKGGDGDVRDHSEPEAGLGGPEPTGQPFDEDEAQLAKRYPKLWARYGQSPLG